MKLLFVLLGVLFVVVDSIERVPTTDPTNAELENTRDDVIEAFDMWGTIQCKLCKEAMRFVGKEVNSDSAKEEIKKALDKACTIILDKSLRRKCRETVEKKGDAIVNAILENLSPDNICKILEFC